MSQLSLPRFPLRGHKHQKPRTMARPLLLEHLDARIVLSGVLEAVHLDAPAQTTTESQPALTDSTAQGAAETVASVYLTEDGVLHAQPVSNETNVVVRQYVNYQLQEVIEVEMAGQWTAFPIEQVREIQLHQVSADRQVNVTEGVTIAVQLIEPETVDAAFASGAADLLVSEPVEIAVVTIGQLAESGPEGEDPGYGSPEETPSPPEILNFQVQEQNGYWQFTGTVTDDKSVAGLKVEFGGLLSGTSTTTNDQGFFSITVPFPPGTFGGVTAVATDTDGLDSAEAYTWVDA